MLYSMPRAYVLRGVDNGSFKKKPPPFASRECSETVGKQAFSCSGADFKKNTWGNVTIIDNSAKNLGEINDFEGMAGNDSGTSQTNLGPTSRRPRRAQCKTIGIPWVSCRRRLVCLEHAQDAASSATEILRLTGNH